MADPRSLLIQFLVEYEKKDDLNLEIAHDASTNAFANSRVAQNMAEKPGMKMRGKRIDKLVIAG